MIKGIYSNYLIVIYSRSLMRLDSKRISTQWIYCHIYFSLPFVCYSLRRPGIFDLNIPKEILIHWTIWSPICINASCLWRERSLFEAAFYSARRRETVSKGLNAPYMWLFKRLRSEQKARSTLIINYLSYINWEAAYLFAFQKKHCACHAAPIISVW